MKPAAGMFVAMFFAAVLAMLMAAQDAAERPNVRRPKQPAHPTIVSLPSGPPRVEFDAVDKDGRTLTASCGTCHANRAANLQNKRAADLDEFHQGLVFRHGTLGCYACHSATDYDQLELADRTLISYPEVMRLCAQCHGKQMTDYQHGAHGGMQGHWDLSRGPRQRKNCIQCHDPHAPEFPRMQPTFKPQDRFLDKTHSIGAIHE